MHFIMSAMRAAQHNLHEPNWPIDGEQIKWLIGLSSHVKAKKHTGQQAFYCKGQTHFLSVGFDKSAEQLAGQNVMNQYKS